MTNRIVRTGIGVVFASAALLAQGGGVIGWSVVPQPARGGTVDGWSLGFQQAGTLTAVQSNSVARSTTGTSSPLAVTGSPFSATEERKTVQTLGDGTLIENGDSNLFFRDSEGRTRVEQDWKGKKVIGIMDPVARFIVQLDPVNKIARKSTIPPNAMFGGIAVQNGSFMMSYSPNGGRGGARGGFGGISPSAPTARGGIGGGGGGGGVLTPQATTPAVGVAAAGGRGGRGAGTAAEWTIVNPVTMGTAATPAKNEDLGSQTQNGVLAQGSRTTITIPQGTIGNNRDINIVSERWYSKVLEMMVKSSNSDPRYGVTTYELAKISQAPPDPSLFTIPADYTVVENGGRGGGMVAAPVIIQQ